MEELNKLLAKHVDEGRFPGIQWQIHIRDKTYYGKVGYNNIESKAPVLDNTIYRIWSMTKPVVAVAALQLLEQNKIELDDLMINMFMFYRQIEHKLPYKWKDPKLAIGYLPLGELDKDINVDDIANNKYVHSWSVYA